ncbi:MAG: cyanophycinase [Anaerolineales bacterium]
MLSPSITLVGSGEYLPVMNEVDARLLARAGHHPPRVVCFPTAAGQEGEESVNRWMQMGVEHFTRLGAEVQALRIIDRASAFDPQWAAPIAAADLIYFSGGDPLYLYHTLVDTPAWEAVQTALARGAGYAGCSAGAMVMGQQVPNVRSLRRELHPAFGLVAAQVIMPHFDRFKLFRPMMLPQVQRELGEGFALGIDEDTALLNAAEAEGEVMGVGTVSVITARAVTVYRAGQRILFPEGGSPRG